MRVGRFCLKLVRNVVMWTYIQTSYSVNKSSSVCPVRTSVLKFIERLPKRKVVTICISIKSCVFSVCISKITRLIFIQLNSTTRNKTCKICFVSSRKNQKTAAHRLSSKIAHDRFTTCCSTKWAC